MVPLPFSRRQPNTTGKQSYLGWMALSCSKNAEKRCSLASLPIQLHRIAHTSFFVQSASERHNAKEASHRNLFLGSTVAAEVELHVSQSSPAQYMHQEQQPTRLLHSRPVLQERAMSHRSHGRSVFTTVLTRTGHGCALRAGCGQCSRTVKAARLKACRKGCV